MRPRNLLFVSPKFTDSFWGFKHALPFYGAKAAFPPLNLMELAAMVPSDWDVKIVDMNVQNIKEGDLRWADVVAISAMVSQARSVGEIIKLCNRFGVPALLGGSILETEEYCQKFPGVTCYFLGEAEETFPEFLSGPEIEVLPKIYKPSRFPNLNFAPVPRYDLVNPIDYAFGAIQDSRGCCHNCSFCSVKHLNGREWRQKSPSQFVAELEAMHKLGWTGSVQVFSDNFIGNIRKAKELLQAIIAWQEDYGYPFTFTIEASILTADDEELMDLMVRAGIKRVFLGLESPNPDCLKECNKPQNINGPNGYPRDLVANVHKIFRHGLVPMSGFIVGFDSDNPKNFAGDMVRFILESGIAVAMVDTLQAQKGTALYDRLESEGRILGDAVNNTAGEPNFVPKMPLATLKAGLKRILAETNSPKGCYERIRILWKHYDPSKRPRIGLGKRKWKAFLRSAWAMGIKEGPRGLYWKTVLSGLPMCLTRSGRRKFIEALNLLVFQYHFQKSERC